VVGGTVMVGGAAKMEAEGGVEVGIGGATEGEGGGAVTAWFPRVGGRVVTGPEAARTEEFGVGAEEGEGLG